MAAVAAGAEVIHASVCGLGERAGNTPLEEAAVAAKALYGLESGIRFDKLGSLADAVREISGFPVAPSKPVVAPSWVDAARSVPPLGFLSPKTTSVPYQMNGAVHPAGTD